MDSPLFYLLIADLDKNAEAHFCVMIVEEETQMLYYCYTHCNSQQNFNHVFPIIPP